MVLLLCSALVSHIWSALSTAGLARTSKSWKHWNSHIKKVKLFYCEGVWTRNRLPRGVWSLILGDIHLTGYFCKLTSLFWLWAGIQLRQDNLQRFPPTSLSLHFHVFVIVTASTSFPSADVRNSCQYFIFRAFKDFFARFYSLGISKILRNLV